MREIVILKGRLRDLEDDRVKIVDGEITFKENGSYVIVYDGDGEYLEKINILDRRVVQLFIYSVDSRVRVKNIYNLGNNSSLIMSSFYHNKGVKEEDIVNLNGKFSSFSSGFVSISEGEEEYHIVVNHNNGFASSKIKNRCVGMDGSSISFVVDSVLKRGNTNCVMDQNTKILTLGDVKTKIRPNMFCSEDDVEARHGSVVGMFREEDIFYLMSRGIERKMAINLLIKGFVFSNLIMDMEYKAKIFDCIQNLRR